MSTTNELPQKPDVEALAQMLDLMAKTDQARYGGTTSEYMLLRTLFDYCVWLDTKLSTVSPSAFKGEWHMGVSDDAGEGGG